MSEPYRTSGLACPHCPGASLREYQQRYACDECNGILIGFDDLKSAIEDLAYVAQTLGYRAERATEIRCPRCERAMTACRLTTTGERTVALDVELLRCDRDGLWLPDGAMAALFAKIGRRWGGAPAPQGAMSRLTNLDAGTPGLGSATEGLWISHWRNRPRRRAKTLTPIDAYGDRQLACPRCPAATLQFQGDRWTCESCQGAFLQDAALIALVEEMTGSQAELPAVAGEPGSRGCPVCRQPMRVEQAAITIDRCAGHGSWFDPGELAATLEVAGGLHGSKLEGWLAALYGAKRG